MQSFDSQRIFKNFYIFQLIESHNEEKVNEKVRTPLINFRLMKKPVFLLVCASSMIGYLGFLTHYVYIIDVAITTVNYLFHSNLVLTKIYII